MSAAKSKTRKYGPKGGDLPTIKLRLAKSGICTPKDQKATIRGLGFRRLGDEVVREDTPAVRGMIRKVRHLLDVTTG